ncbi:hypothetical protein GCM10027085_50660 [Spirosoma aerophilum]
MTLPDQTRELDSFQDESIGVTRTGPPKRRKACLQLMAGFFGLCSEAGWPSGEVSKPNELTAAISDNLGY